MAEYLIQGSTLTAIADAIRAKTSTTNSISTSDMANLIESISAGAELNFDIVGGTIEPSNPEENMIWVDTDVPITGYYFSATEPENMVEGEVWIKTGYDSIVAFDVVDNVTTYPLSVKQYVNNALLNKDAKSYQNGTWTSWNFYFYWNGNQYTDITGGWTVSNHRNGTASIGTNTLIISHTGTEARECTVFTVNPINFDNNYKILKADVSITANGDRLVFGLSSQTSYKYAVSNSIVNTIKSTTTGDFTLSVDISNVSGTYYIFLYGGQVKATIRKIWAEF